MHPFDGAIALEAVAKGLYRGRTSAVYENMVGPYGGTTGAALLQAAWQHPERIGEPVALTVNFAAALAHGDFTIEVEVVRTNRSTQHWCMKMSQGSEIFATATAVFAKRRETWSRPEAKPPAAPAAATLASADPSGKPPWVRCYDMRFVRGDAFAGFDEVEQTNSESIHWVRDEPPRPLDFPALAAVCDSYFPRIFVRRHKWVPIGTVSLTTYFHADERLLQAQADRHMLGRAWAVNFRNGYFDQSAELWSDGGDLLASTHQLVYFRE